MAPKNKGGRVMEAFVAEHFTKHGPKITLPAPLNTGFNDASLDGPESITDEEIAAEFDKLDEQLFATEDGDRLAPDVPLNQVFDLTDLDSIRNGSGVAITIEEEMSLNGDGGSMGNWAPESLLQSLGI
ncbi:hypothetical protein BDZ94DRAFT_1244368 [Collybia nuda]|uniref:Uncharacterized protein n=1 Tax=Collybia nuda TaxID=64659 RepID=A0A9P6CPN1_9AGAR|nr:hypothetical protein BDZ94DRAFT_1244368 [Collybia nuda]